MNARSGDNTIAIPFVSEAGIKKFFKNYGSTDNKFHLFETPSITYIGYVGIDINTEHVVMVNSSGATSYVTSFMPPYQFANDLLSLMKKREFLDSIIKGMQNSRA